MLSLPAKGIRSNKSMHMLVFQTRANYDPTSEFIAHVESLKVNAALEVLDLCGLNLSAECTEALSGSLVHNRKVVVHLNAIHEYILSLCSFPEARVKFTY